MADDVYHMVISSAMLWLMVIVVNAMIYHDIVNDNYKMPIVHSGEYIMVEN